MGEEKTKTSKALKRTRETMEDDGDLPSPKRNRALTPDNSSAKRTSAPFRTPAFTRTPVRKPLEPGSSDATAIEMDETPTKPTKPSKSTKPTSKPASKKGCKDDKKKEHISGSDKGKAKIPLPTPTPAKTITTPAKASPTPSIPLPSSSKAKENRPVAAKPKGSIHAPFKPPKITNAAAAKQLKAQLAVVRAPSFGPSAELSLIEKRDLLKRAIRTTKDDERTKELIIKWRTTGRDVANDLCKLIEDSGMVEQMVSARPQRSSSGGGFDGGWGFGPRVKSRFENSWGWLDADKKPERGWGWQSVNDHLSEGREGEEEHEHDYEREEQEEVELPSAERLKKELETALNQPYKKRKSLIPLTDSDAFYEAMGERGAEEAEAALLREQLDEMEKEEEKADKRWGVGRLLDELGIPHKMFGWDEEAEDWVQDA